MPSSLALMFSLHQVPIDKTNIVIKSKTGENISIKLSFKLPSFIFLAFNINCRSFNNSINDLRFSWYRLSLSSVKYEQSLLKLGNLFLESEMEVYEKKKISIVAFCKFKQVNGIVRNHFI